LTPLRVSGQEKTPIGGEWADFDCPMPVIGMPSTRILREPPDAPREAAPTPNPDLRRHPMPVLSRRCRNPLAMGMPLAMKFELTVPGGSQEWSGLFDWRGRPRGGRFGLDDALGPKTDSTPPSLLLLPEGQP
jgi:hypothetical protein